MDLLINDESKDIISLHRKENVFCNYREMIYSWLFFSFALTSGYLGCIFMLGPILLISSVLSYELYDSAMSSMVTFWLDSMMCLLEWMFHIKIYLYIDEEESSSHSKGQNGKFTTVLNDNASSLIVMNHLTTFDWLFFFSVTRRFYQKRMFKIVLKNSLRFLPGIGWAMLNTSYIFLRRKWQLDEAKISHFFRRFAKESHPCNILLFCEGTNLTEGTRKKCNDYAADKKLPLYRNVLHPRTTGICHMIKCIRETKLDIFTTYLDDVTVAYNNPLICCEDEIFRGRIPKEIHYYFHRYNLNELPKKDDEIAAWVCDLWKEKEKRMTEYLPVRRFGKYLPNPLHLESFWGAFAKIIFWIQLFVLSIYTLIHFNTVKIFFVLCNVFFLALAFDVNWNGKLI